MISQLQLRAPAKVNRFLHIVGQRPDGYHLLQTVFQLIDLEDHITLNCRADGTIIRTNGPTNVKPEDDLVIRAAQLLKNITKTPLGCNIHLQKTSPWELASEEARRMLPQCFGGSMRCGALG